MALWVFGYGSLIWDPGFDPAERRLAVLAGYSRSFCMRSIHHRGTPELPGLVLALDRDADASCTGIGFRVRDGEEAQVAAYLRDRELISSAYLEERHVIRLVDDGSAVEATAFVVDPHHAQYCGGLPLDEQARLIARSTGGRGRNDDYLYNTRRHLAELGIGDPDLDWLEAEVRRLTGRSGAA